jgi:hypothetical protein
MLGKLKCTIATQVSDSENQYERWQICLEFKAKLVY